MIQDEYITKCFLRERSLKRKFAVFYSIALAVLIVTSVVAITLGGGKNILSYVISFLSIGIVAITWYYSTKEIGYRTKISILVHIVTVLKANFFEWREEDVD